MVNISNIAMPAPVGIIF